jgi:hypothetical protein
MTSFEPSHHPKTQTQIYCTGIRVSVYEFQIGTTQFIALNI